MILKLEQEIKNILKKNNFDNFNFLVSKPTNLEFGEFTSNVALAGAKITKLKPQELAQIIVDGFDLKKHNYLKKIEVVQPGFINFFLQKDYYSQIISDVLNQGNNFGKQKPKQDLINVEFVSANPTGFLHVAHARGAALGDSLSNILEFAGYQVNREYYINDAGNQIDRLAISIWTRYQQLYDRNVELPEDSYGGTDIIWGAQKAKEIIGDKWLDVDFNDIKEEIKKISTSIMLEKIKTDLELMRVSFDIWFSEKSLYENNDLEKHIENLKGTYKKDDALWLETTKFGDDKDRVLIKSDGMPTYFLSDTIYHVIKAKRNPSTTKLIDIWGADHIGYIKRVEVAMELQGYEDLLEVITIQLVKLIKDGKELKMSKRKGTSLFLSELIEQVGADTARFFLINRTANSQIDFDLNLANLKTNDNPVFIVQYAHARISQLINKSKLKDNLNYEQLNFEESEYDLINLINQFPELIDQISQNYKVNLLAQYLIDLAREFNSFYSNSKIIGTKRENDLICLSKACGIILKNGLKLLGVSAPERM